MAAASHLRLVRSAPELAPRESDKTRAFALAAAGTLTEISSERASGRSTLALSFVREAQAEGETVAWLMHDAVCPYGPDVIASGIDLDALLVVRLPRAMGPRALVRAAEILLRSGGFGLVAIDLVDGVPEGMPAAWQGRLLGLAREHRARVVLLSSSPASAPSLGPLVTTRLEPELARSGRGFLLVPHALKHKGGPVPELVTSIFAAPDGL